MTSSASFSTALRLLGPENMGSKRATSLCQKLEVIIHRIAITILRIVQFVFGDQVWYDNAKARNILIKALQSPKPLNADEYQKADQLYLALQNRRMNPLSSYADGIYLKEGMQRIARLEQLRERAPHRESLSSLERLKANFQEGKTGLLSSLSPGNLGPPPQQVNLVKLENRPGGPFLRFGVSLLEDERMKDPSFAHIQDFVELLKVAIQKSLSEFGYKNSDLILPGFADSRDMVILLRIAFFNLLCQADIENDSCKGPYLLINQELSLHSPKAIPTYVYKNGIQEALLYEDDLLSGAEVGCDPVRAASLIKQLNGYEKSLFKRYLLSGTDDIQHQDINPEWIQLFHLINTMALQAKHRYGNSIQTLCQSGSFEGVSTARLTFNHYQEFQDFIAHAKTPHHLLYLSSCYAMQKYASLGLITQEDASNEMYAHFERLVCRQAVLDLLKGAHSPHDFCLQLHPLVTLNLGSFVAYTSSEGMLHQAERHYLPHLLGGSNPLNEDRPVSDPILAYSIMKELSEEDLLLLEQLVLRVPLQAFYKQVGLMKEAKVLEFLDINKLSIGRKKLVQTTYDQICTMSSYLAKCHFPLMRARLVDHEIENPKHYPKVIFRSDVIKPQTVPFQRLTPPKIQQEALWNFILPSGLRKEEILIKNQKESQEPPRYPKTLEEVKKDRLSALKAQNDSLNFIEAGEGNCLYGALAIQLFGKEAAFRNLHRYIRILRGLAADYILANRSSYLYDQLRDQDKDNPISEEVLNQRLIAHCRQIRNENGLSEYGTASELRALSHVFGIAIHIFYLGDPDAPGGPQLSVGIRGHEKGLILPNSMINEHYAGKPMRLLLSAIHYYSLTLKT